MNQAKHRIKESSAPELRSDWRYLEQRKITSKNELQIEGHKLILVNLEREVWDGIPKAKLFEYYHNIFPYLSRYIHDRPLALHVSLHRAKGADFFIRGMDGHQPSWAKVFRTERKHKKEGKSKYVDYLVCNDEATLFYIINLECVDLHPWSSRITSPEYPDYLVIDIDPSDGDFSKVVEVLKAARPFFQKQKLKTYIKTSGKTGIHTYIPCHGIHFGNSRLIAERISEKIHEMIPDLTSIDFTVKKRGDKVFVDPSQNDYADRLAAPYCLRAFEQPLVAAPIEWKEVNKKLSPENFNIDTIFPRLEKKGDIFEGMFSEEITSWNTSILKKFL